MELFTNSFLHSLANSLERPLTKKLKSKQLDNVFEPVWNVLILWNSKSTWLCISENKLFVTKIMAKNANLLC